ncbi:MAG: D-lyxose/D-mannose family sugar isomerase [Bacteroidota bacterium]
MKRSEINFAVKEASDFFKEYHWVLPPAPRWDVTDFGLGDFEQFGLVLVNLAEEEEYCEKLMYANKGQTTPSHAHKKKKEDIICRIGELKIIVWNNDKELLNKQEKFTMKVNGEEIVLFSGSEVILKAGERLTIVPEIYHQFYPISEACIIGEVSTANDDANDNFFINNDIGRFSEIEEDEPSIVKLVNEI